MRAAGNVSPPVPRGARFAPDWKGVVLAAACGAAGGTLGAWLAEAPVGGGALTGGTFGLLGAAALGGRTASPGAGLVWGLGGGFLLWVMLASAAVLVHPGGPGAVAMLGSANARLPSLFVCLLGIGAPAGIALGIRGALGRSVAPLHWERALVAGGAAGLVAALIFSRWMYAGDFFPLISGFGSVGSHGGAVALHVGVACLIGCTFGLLFQTDLRNPGSAMGWGVAYALFWWLLGSMTLFPLASGRRPDWSAAHANELFGPLVGYIFFGLILGVVYSGANSVWTRLFVDSDPLNRKREGPGIHLVLSVGWGSAAGFAGGLIALPLVVQTGAGMGMAGSEGPVSLAAAVLLHLAVSTVIGASYGILFRGESTDPVSCSLWGFMLGVLAWYAGPLTLLPLLRTGECDWRPEAAAALLPSLVGHLLFGVVTANVFSAFERAKLRRLQPARRPVPRDLDAAPGSRPTAPLCLFVFGLAVLFPILLS